MANFEDFQEDTQLTGFEEYHYRFYLKDGTMLDDHGWLIVTPSIAAIGFGKGQIKMALPLADIHHVTRVDEQVLNA